MFLWNFVKGYFQDWKAHIHYCFQGQNNRLGGIFSIFICQKRKLKVCTTLLFLVFHRFQCHRFACVYLLVTFTSYVCTRWIIEISWNQYKIKTNQNKISMTMRYLTKKDVFANFGIYKMLPLICFDFSWLYLNMGNPFSQTERNLSTEIMYS